MVKKFWLVLAFVFITSTGYSQGSLYQKLFSSKLQDILNKPLVLPTTTTIRPLGGEGEGAMPWLHCAIAYQDMADAYEGVKATGAQPMAKWIQVADFAGHIILDCYGSNLTPDLRQAALRGFAHASGELQMCWSADPSTPRWPSECVHPAVIGRDIGALERELETAGITDARVADSSDPINSVEGYLRSSGSGGPGFSSSIPYFMVADGNLYDLDPEGGRRFMFPEVSSLRFLRTHVPYESGRDGGGVRRVYDQYYQFGRSVICINEDIQRLADACRR